MAVAIQLLHPNATNSGTRAAANTTTLGGTTLTNNGSSTGSSTLHRQSSFTSSSNNLKSLASTQLSASAGGASAAAVDLPPRVLILTEEGGMLIVDIEGFQLRSVGFFTVKVEFILCSSHLYVFSFLKFEIGCLILCFPFMWYRLTWMPQYCTEPPPVITKVMVRWVAGGRPKRLAVSLADSPAVPLPVPSQVCFVEKFVLLSGAIVR